MAVEITPLGFKKPSGGELVRDGDNMISDNAQVAQDQVAEARARLALLETSAGFPGDPIELADDVVQVLITDPSDTRAAMDGRYTQAAELPAAVTAEIEDTGSPVRGALSATFVAKVSLFHNVRDYGAVGDGVADDTAACQSAINAATGTTARFPSGIFKVGQLTIPSNTAILLDTGAVIQHNNTGAVFRAAGVQSAVKPLLTVNAVAGASTVTAPGHGLIADDTFRLSSNAIFDASSTSIKVGELLTVASVAGDVITVTEPICGVAYNTADAAYTQKITPVRNIRISGGGVIRGTKTGAMGQYGIDVLMGRDITIENITTENIDRRHIYLSDCINAWVNNCRIKWAVDTTMAYGVSFANCTSDSGVRDSYFEYVRHSLSTNNESTYPGIVRRITFDGNTVVSTSTALGGSMSGGDAIDTHTAAEDIWITNNEVISSAGQGINFECRSGVIINNTIKNCASGGISVHSECDLPARITVAYNEVRRCGATGINIRSGVRGTTAVYEQINASHNRVFDVAGNGVMIGLSTATTAPMTGIVALANTIVRAAGSFALVIVNASGVAHEHNRGIGGSTTISVTDSEVATGDHPGYLFRAIASDAVNITRHTTYLVVDTEAAAASDTLATITGGLKGQIIVVRVLANARDVIVGGSGNIRTTAAMTLDNSRDTMTLGYDGINWIEQARADFPAA